MEFSESINEYNILIAIFIVFAIMMLFFFLSLNDLSKLEAQEKYDRTHTLYEANEFNQRVQEWTNQGVGELMKDERFRQWQNARISEQLKKSEILNKKSL